jgi:hypothetical protein
MTQDPLILKYRRVEYPPDDSLELSRYLSQGMTTDLAKLNPLFERLIQIEFTVKGKRILFPDFDNIFTRPESVRGWWFLTPEVNGKAIHQSDTDISAWWNKFQDIYKSSILSKKEPFTCQLGFLMLSSNDLIYSLLSQLLITPDRLSTVDEKDLVYPNVYSYNLFRDCRIENYWRVWIWKKAVIHYYHLIFAPALLGNSNKREELRLSNRFPEYASAVRELATLREVLYSKSCTKESVDKFFSLQATKLKEEADARKKASRGWTFSLCQCRVCGVIFLVIKKQGRSKQACSSSDCKNALESFRKLLPPIPNDYNGGKILISHL